MRYGTIFDIKQFAVFDGPGLRQTVFLKGCPLRCSWCDNPEGQSPLPQMMVSVASCVHCGACLEICPSPGGCIVCGRCVDVCPLHLRRISGERVSSEELETRLRKDAGFYQRNGGGVTFGGGEPLAQPEFLIEVLQRCAGMHRAIETSGYAEPEVYKQVCSHLDLVIQDMKLFDEEEHIRYVGRSNRWILRNVDHLKRGDKPFIIRIPLIPGVTDTKRNLGLIASFLKGAKRLERVELLPYITVAGAKYEMIGRKYKPDFDPAAKPNIDQSCFEDAGIRSKVL